jgi:hypothetical protein
MARGSSFCSVAPQSDIDALAVPGRRRRSAPGPHCPRRRHQRDQRRHTAMIALVSALRVLTGPDGKYAHSFGVVDTGTVATRGRQGWQPDWVAAKQYSSMCPHAALPRHTRTSSARRCTSRSPVTASLGPRGGCDSSVRRGTLHRCQPAWRRSAATAKGRLSSLSRNGTPSSSSTTWTQLRPWL